MGCFINSSYVTANNPDGYHEGDSVFGDVPVDPRPGPNDRLHDGGWKSGPAPVPASVSRFQARAALTQAGLLDKAEDAVTKAGGLTQLAWNDAQSFNRSSPTIAALAEALALSVDEVDELFIAAAKIQA